MGSNNRTSLAAPDGCEEARREVGARRRAYGELYVLVDEPEKSSITGSALAVSRAYGGTSTDT